MYKEVNPGLFAIVSFPFLFGVMFGDMGHGVIMFLLGLFLIFGKNLLKGTSLEEALKARYLIFMMSCFAIYNGFIYNECFAIPIDFFGSCYSREPGYYDTVPFNATKPGDFYFRRTDFDCIYTFGIDPRWA